MVAQLCWMASRTRSSSPPPRRNPQRFGSPARRRTATHSAGMCSGSKVGSALKTGELTGTGWAHAADMPGGLVRGNFSNRLDV